MADPSDVEPARDGAYSDRAAKRGREPGLSPRMAHAIHGAAAGATLSAVGLAPMEHPIPFFAMATVTVVGSGMVGSARERYGERRGREAGLQEGRRQGREAALRETHEHSSRRGYLPLGRQPVKRDRGGR